MQLIDNTQTDASMRKTHIEVGKKYFIRTVTHHYIGIAREICELGVVFDNAIWVADDGRFSTFMSGNPDSNFECEAFLPTQRVLLCYGPMVDVTEWPFELAEKHLS